MECGLQIDITQYACTVQEISLLGNMNVDVIVGWKVASVTLC